MDIGPLCDKVCSVIYKKSAVTVLRLTREVLLRGWREVKDAQLWKLSLLPNAQP